MTFMQSTEVAWADVDIPDASIDFLATDIVPDAGGGHVDPLMVPPDAPVGAGVAHLKRSEYASGGSVWVLARGAGSSQAAGVCLSSASCGRAWLNSSRKWVNVCVWARRLASGGRVVSACSVRCLRS